MDVKTERKRKEGLRDCLFGENNAEVQTKGQLGKHYIHVNFHIHVPITVVSRKSNTIYFFFC